MNFFARGITALLFGFLFLTGSAFAVTTTFTAVADTTIKSSSATSNFGTATVLEHDAYPADFASLLRFDLSSIPSNATVTAVSLTLYVTNSSPASFQLYGLNRAFSESQATWNQAASGVNWGTAGATNSSDRDNTDFGPVIGTTANASLTVNLNSAGVAEVQSWVTDTSVNYGFIIQNYNDSTNGDGLDVASRQAGTASQRPQLTVTYTVPTNSVPDITTTTLPGATQGNAYSQTLAATGGDGALVWSLASGTLPGGLTLSSAGVISGTPSATGTFNFTVRVADSDTVTGASDEDTQSLSIAVASGGGGSTTVTFRDGESSYAGTTDTTIKSDATSTNFGSATLLENDGTPDYSSLLRFDLSSIPSGATVTAASLTFHVSNASNQAYQIFALKRAFTEGSATWNVAASGGNWQTAGASGSNDRESTTLGTINASSTGAITVTLNADGIAKVQSWVTSSSSNYGFIIQNYSNSDGLDLASSEASTVSQRPRLSVTYTGSGGGSNSVPEITTTTLPDGTQNVAYSQNLAATGGDGALVWSIASGALPSGITLTSAGVIGGTPTVSGSFNFTVRVADSDAVTGASDEDTQALTLIIAPASVPGWKKTPLVSAARHGQVLSGASLIDGGEGAQVVQTIAMSERFNGASDSSFLLIGTDVGGVYASRDNGLNWSQANVGYYARGAVNVIIDPLNSQRALAVGGNDNSNISISEFHGIFLSGNQARTWSHPVRAKNYISRLNYNQTIAYDPSVTTTINGATSTARAYWSTPANTQVFTGGNWVSTSGIMVSNDGGVTWSLAPNSAAYADSEIFVGLPGTSTAGVVFVATNSAATKALYRGSYSVSNGFAGLAVVSGLPANTEVTGVCILGATVWVSTPDKLWRSTNGGVNFTEVTTNLPAPGAFKFRNISVNRSGAEAYYQLCLTSGEITNAGGNNTVYYSTDSNLADGQTWYAGANYDNTNSFIEFQRRPTRFVWPHDSNAYVFTVGADYVLRCGNFSSVASDPANIKPQYAWWSDGYNGIAARGRWNFGFVGPNGEPPPLVVAAVDYQGGFTLNTNPADGVPKWTKLFVTGQSFGGTATTGFTADGTELLVGKNVTVGTQNRISLHTSTDGSTWTQAPGGPFYLVEPRGTTSDNVSTRIESHTLALKNASGTVVTFWAQYRRVGSGSWTAMWNQSNPTVGCKAAVTHGTRNGTTILWGLTDLDNASYRATKIVKSTDFGATWTAVLTAPSAPVDRRTDDIADLAYDPVNDYLYVATRSAQELYRIPAASTITTVREINYNNERITTNLAVDQDNDQLAMTVAVDPVDPSIVYVAAPGRDRATSTAAQVSVDSGETWTNITLTGFENNPIDGGREATHVRVHPQTREAWFTTSCYGIWRY